MAAIDLDRIKDQGKRFVDGFTPGQKAMTILGVIAVVFAGMAFTKWSSTTDYAPLYTSLSGADAGKVTQALDSAGVKWKLADGGASVLVPSNMVYKERVALSAQGLPTSSDGLALLDKEGITASEFVQRVDYRPRHAGRAAEDDPGDQRSRVGNRQPHHSTRPGVRGRAGRQPDRGSARATVGTRALVRQGPGDREPRRVEHPQHDTERRDRRRLERQRAERAGHEPREQPGTRTAERLRHRARHGRVELHRDGARTESRCGARADRHELRSDQEDEPHDERADGQERQRTTAAVTADDFEGELQRRRGRGGRQPRHHRDPRGGQRQHPRELLEDAEPDDQRARPGRDRGQSSAGQDQPAVGGRAARQLHGEARRRHELDEADPDRGRLRRRPRRLRAGHAGRVQHRRAEGRQATAERRVGLGGTGRNARPRPYHRDATRSSPSCCSSPGARSRRRSRTGSRCAYRSTSRELETAETRAIGPAASMPRLADLEPRALQPALDSGSEGELGDLIEHQPDEVAQTLRSWLADRRA